MRVFIEFQKIVRGRACKTLLNYVASFTHYFNSNNLCDLTKTLSFRKYRRGLAKQMKSQNAPNRKLPLTPEILQKLFDDCDLKKLEDLSFITAITVMYYGFFRASKFIQLRWKDISFTQFEEQNQTKNAMLIHLLFSKTDVTGKGVIVEIAETKHQYDPLKLVDLLRKMVLPNEESSVWIYSLDTLRLFLKKRLTKLRIPNPEKYSLHSCRRGGAHTAALNGIPDSSIKAHGRCLNEAYHLYPQMDARTAGRLITSLI